MFNFLGAMICKWKGHRWSKAKDFAYSHPEMGNPLRFKHCLRCGLEREVKTRKVKVAP